MKFQKVFLFLLLSVFAISCVDDLANYGVGTQPASDAISIGTDTFHLSTENIFVDFMYSNPDTFLLGTFYNEKYGSTRADILAQVNCPTDFKFPPNSTPDSVLLVLYYKTWFGDKFAPLDINVYEMNKKTFSYTKLYPTNINPADYTDLSLLLGHRLITARSVAKSTADSSSIVIKLSSDFAQRLFNDQYYTNETTFTNFFKGFYITANYGASTILSVRQIAMEYYTHYKYQKPGVDTLTLVRNVVTFPANKEVRQVNRFEHPDRDVMVKFRDSVNYVASPANLQTRVNIPLSRIQQQMDKKIAGKKQVINNAILKVDATEVKDSSLEIPIVSYMLLIKESAVVDFFKNKELPNDTSAVLGQLSSSATTTAGVYQYFYGFNLARLVANELRIAKKNNTTPASNIPMVLVPVSVTKSSTAITAIRQQYKMSAVTIRSGKVFDASTGLKINTEPMHIKLVYSGF